MQKFIAGLIAITITTGCTTHKAIVPALEGKALIKINQENPEPVLNETEED